MSTSPAAHDDTSSSIAQLNPAVVIYQNPDFVSGLLQTILGAGRVGSAETEDQGRITDDDCGDATGAKVVASVNFAGFGGIDAHGDLQRVRDNVHADETNRAQRLTYVFSQAYYLNLSAVPTCDEPHCDLYGPSPMRARSRLVISLSTQAPSVRTKSMLCWTSPPRSWCPPSPNT